MTLRDIESILAGAGIESAKSDALRLAESASGLSRASLLARYGEDISDLHWFRQLSDMAARRARREPLQYILGKWEFYGDEYTVTPDVLIPRPETEMLVDYALAHLPHSPVIADLCCGSGCIGIAVCRNTDAHCDSVDISGAALRVAAQNALSLGVGDRIKFMHGDVLRGTLLHGTYDMIISNPPYVKTSEMAELSPELSFEPSIALDGGGDGMMFYRRIIEDYSENLTPGGVFLFEIGRDLGDDMTSLAERHGFSADILPDLAGLPRMAVLSRSKTDR